MAPVAAGLVAAVALASTGGVGDPAAGIAAVLDMCLRGGLLSAAWWLAALGWGELARRAITGRDHAPAMRLGLGAAVLVVLGLAVGEAGLLGPIGLGLLGLPALAGLVLWVKDRRTPKRAVVAGPVEAAAWSLGAIGVAVMLVAAANPPGSLWASEFGGYDALSYHLPLARDWAAAGRITSLDSCVYSSLPSGMESAFAWLLVGSAGGLTGDGGWRLIALQVFCATWIIAGAWTVSRAASRAARLCGVRRDGARIGGAIAGAALLATPWNVVVGSLAYNEPGVVMLAGTALLAATGRRAVRAGVACGLLMGAACLMKPTALFLVGPVVGCLMLWRFWRFGAVRVTGMIAAGCVAGTLCLSPWLARNAAASGNPVFPFATSFFGEGAWDTAQVERWSAAHTADGSLGDRLMMAVWQTPGSSPNAPTVERFRGLANPQWAGLWVAVAAGGAILVLSRRSRWAGISIIVGIGVGLGAWLALTHIQSRFLVPTSVAGCAAIGVAAAGRASAARWAGLAIVGIQAGAAVWVFLVQPGGPNATLPLGAAARTGAVYSEAVAEAFPTAWMNRELPKEAVVLFVGESRTAYVDRRAIWSSAWDRGLLAQSLANGENAAGTLASMRQAGVTHIYVSFAELSRLRDSGYTDERMGPESVASLLAQIAEPVRGWERLGSAVFRVKDAR